jgi:hypothetical protein
VAMVQASCLRMWSPVRLQQAGILDFRGIE